MVLLPYSFCVGDITRSMGNIVSYMYYFSHMHFFFINEWCITLYFGPIHGQWSYPVIPMCLPTTLFDVLQLLCLINKSTVTSPVETFPSLTLVFQDKSFGSVFKMNCTLPFLGFVMLTSPMSYWVCAPTTILGSISSDQAYRYVFVLNYRCHFNMLMLFF